MRRPARRRLMSVEHEVDLSTSEVLRDNGFQLLSKGISFHLGQVRNGDP